MGQAVESGRFSRKTGSFWVQRVVLVAKADIFPTVFATRNRICTRKVTSRGVCGAARSDVATCSAQRRPCGHPPCGADPATRRCAAPAVAATRRAQGPASVGRECAAPGIRDARVRPQPGRAVEMSPSVATSGDPS